MDAAKKKRVRRPSGPTAESSVADSAVGTADTSRGAASTAGAGTGTGTAGTTAGAPAHEAAPVKPAGARPHSMCPVSLGCVFVFVCLLCRRVSRGFLQRC